MKYSLKIKASALKEISGLEKRERRKIVAAIDSLPSAPLQGTLLKGAEMGLRRLRVGSYRIVYEVQQRTVVILVLRVAHRREVYR